MDRHLSRSRWPFWGPLAAILGFADCAALQSVNECPRLVFISIPPQGGGGTRVSYNVQSFVVFQGLPSQDLPSFFTDCFFNCPDQENIF